MSTYFYDRNDEQRGARPWSLIEVSRAKKKQTFNRRERKESERPEEEKNDIDKRLTGLTLMLNHLLCAGAKKEK